MPGPAVAGGAAAAESFIATDAASNVIAIIGVGIGTGVTVGALPADMVAIGNVSISIAPQNDIYVGDRIVLTAQVDVSFGEIDFDGTGGEITIELIEDGTGILKTEKRTARGPKESYTVRYTARTINHGTKLYYCKVTATGEEDHSYWPTGDTTVTRERESDTVSLDVKKPIEVTTVLLSPSVSHGQFARAFLKVSNHSESSCWVFFRMGSKFSRVEDLRGEQMDVRLIDCLEAHGGDNHSEEVIWVIEPVKFLIHTQVIQAGGVIFYSQIEPDKEIVYDPVPVTCTGEQKVSYLGDDWDNQHIKDGEYAYACAVLNGDNQPLACTAFIGDDYGNTIPATVMAGSLQFQGRLLGETGFISLTPASEIFNPYAFRIPLNTEFFKQLPDTFIFYPAPIPPIRGIIYIAAENLPVAGCIVALKTADDKSIYRTVTDADGRFTVYSSARNIETSEYLIMNISLPWDITFNWTSTSITRKIPKAEILKATLQVVHIEVAPQDNWVELSGIVSAKDALTKNRYPIKGIQVNLVDEVGEIHDKTTSNDNGEYSLGSKPGRYFIEVKNPVELGYNEIPSKLFTARSSKTNVDITLTLPVPVIEYHSHEVIRLKLPEGTSIEKLAILKNGKILKEMTASKNIIHILSKDLESGEGLEVAIAKDGFVGSPLPIRF